MMTESCVPPLRWMLPFAQLLFCIAILWPMHTMLVNEIRTSLRAYGSVHELPERDHTGPQRAVPFDLSDPEVQRRIKRSEAREWFVATLNLPGGLPDLVYSMVSPAHEGWIPRGMFMWVWRDISWPIVGTFFWWLAGRSIEALLSARHKILQPRIGWWEVVISIPVLAYGGIWPVMISVDRSSRAEFLWWPLLVVFGSLWLALGACTVAAAIVQWRLQRRYASGAVVEAATGSAR
jgi:hypothetical protein